MNCQLGKHLTKKFDTGRVLAGDKRVVMKQGRPHADEDLEAKIISSEIGCFGSLLFAVFVAEGEACGKHEHLVSQTW